MEYFEYRMLKKIQTWLHPFPKSFWLNNAYDSDNRDAVYESWKEQLKDWRFWLGVAIFIGFICLVKHYGHPAPVDIRDWHYG